MGGGVAGSGEDAEGAEGWAGARLGVLGQCPHPIAALCCGFWLTVGRPPQESRRAKRAKRRRPGTVRGRMPLRGVPRTRGRPRDARAFPKSRPFEDRAHHLSPGRPTTLPLAEGGGDDSAAMARPPRDQPWTPSDNRRLSALRPVSFDTTPAFSRVTVLPPTTPLPLSLTDLPRPRARKGLCVPSHRSGTRHAPVAPARPPETHGDGRRTGRGPSWPVTPASPVVQCDGGRTASADTTAVAKEFAPTHTFFSILAAPLPPCSAGSSLQDPADAGADDADRLDRLEGEIRWQMQSDREAQAGLRRLLQLQRAECDARREHERQEHEEVERCHQVRWWSCVGHASSGPPAL